MTEPPDDGYRHDVHEGRIRDAFDRIRTQAVTAADRITLRVIEELRSSGRGDAHPAHVVRDVVVQSVNLVSGMLSVVFGARRGPRDD